MLYRLHMIFFSLYAIKSGLGPEQREEQDQAGYWRM